MVNEKVMVIPASRLDKLANKFKGGLYQNPLPEELKNLLGDEVTYMDRDLAEKDENFKQIIPYVIVSSKDKQGDIFFYRRTKMAGEARLHGKWSVGIGGHINPCDGICADADTYFKALQRELFEEIGTAPYTEVDAPLVSLLYDDTDDVGKVHLGFVHSFACHADQIKSDDPSICSGAARDNDHSDKQFENWSKILMGTKN